jgi:DNA-binding response OmpR family regulator
VNALPGLGHYVASDVPTSRFREAGDLTLDLFHRDGRVEDRWLGLHAREFAILWRLAEHPGALVGEEALLADLLRARVGCEIANIAEQVERLADRLADFGLGGLIARHPAGGYLLAACTVPGVLPGTAPHSH